jgi:hypothetical protein
MVRRSPPSPACNLTTHVHLKGQERGSEKAIVTGEVVEKRVHTRKGTDAGHTPSILCVV